jgi:hypothetical protein
MVTANAIRVRYLLHRVNTAHIPYKPRDTYYQASQRLLMELSFDGGEVESGSNSE